MSAAFRQQPLGARFEDERFEAPCFGGRGGGTRGGQAEVAATLVRLVRLWLVALRRLLDQAVGEHAAQRAVEVAGHDLVEPAALLHLADESPAVALSLDEREQDLEYERFQRLSHAGR